MAESNREPPLCPCGFWGSTQTSGLCSKCYKEMLKRKECSPGSSSATPLTAPPSNPVKVVVTPASPNHPTANSSLSVASHSPTKWPKGRTENDSTEAKKLSSKSESSDLQKGDETEAGAGHPAQEAGKNIEQQTNADCVSESGAETAETHVAKIKDLDLMANAQWSEEKSVDTTPVEEGSLTPERSVQKNKRKCFKCRCKLDLASCELGRCKCDYVFCELHRLPEQHDCSYDHKGMGRQEARQKMVSPKKQVGTSLKRLDSDS